MCSMESENMQFDDTDLIFDQPTMQVPPQKQVELVTDFLQRFKGSKIHRLFNMKSERDKIMKQWRYSKEQLAYYFSKTEKLEYRLNKNAKELERLSDRMIAELLQARRSDEA